MTNSTQTLEENHRLRNQNPGDSHNDQSQGWVRMAQSWLSTFPEGRTATMPEFEAWFDSNHDSLPEDVKSMSRSDIYQTLMTIHKSLATPHQLQEKDVNEGSASQARFQRTDQWIPVYAWLESLDKDEVVKSKDIADWLSANPAISEQLGSRHTRYHLMHYIKKCHVKILKRRERKKGLLQPNKTTPVKVQKAVVTKPSVPVPVPVPGPGDSLPNVPKDDDLNLAKRNEALQKYEIGVGKATLYPLSYAQNKLKELGSSGHLLHKAQNRQKDS